MSWALSTDAKRVRKLLYGQFLAHGASQGVGALLKDTGLGPARLDETMAELQRALMVMCPPGTLDVGKCPPWSNVPTRHGVELRGKHVCHAGCALEAMNIGYCYPGEDVTVRSSCPQTGREIVMRLREGRILDVKPDSMVGHAGVDPAKWMQNWFHGCANNNFFASAAAVEAWEAAHPQFRGVTLTTDQLQQFARYDNRLDYERGADRDDALNGAAMFGWTGAAIPPHWA